MYEVSCSVMLALDGNYGKTWLTLLIHDETDINHYKRSNITRLMIYGFKKEAA